MRRDCIAVVDVETTGLSPWRHDRIIEIAIVLIDPTGEVHCEYETLVNPQRDIGPSRIHHLSAGDVLKAPTFGQIAGDVLELLASATVFAGHNVRFDHSFLAKEYERVGVSLPAIPLFCTYQLFGRGTLTACCDELGIARDDEAHRALADARATSQLVREIVAADVSTLAAHRISNVTWPSLQPLKTPCYRRDEAIAARGEPDSFLQKVLGRLRHDAEADSASILAYMAMIDRALEDRRIDEGEAVALSDWAGNWGLTADQVQQSHKDYLHNLAVAALSDGVVSTAERVDLHMVARLLGHSTKALDEMIDRAISQLQPTQVYSKNVNEGESVVGRRVCFTGELRSTINGESITRDTATALAEQEGMVVVSNVSKKVDLLVVADPDTQSGKARKAREYGIRIVADAVFWKMIGVSVD